MWRLFICAAFFVPTIVLTSFFFSSPQLFSFCPSIIKITGKYRGTTDSSTECLGCKPGYAASMAGQPFCLDCDAGKYESNSNSIECINCVSGTYEPDKRATKPCKRCLNEEEVPNDQKSGCVGRPEDPNAAIAILTSMNVTSSDGKVIELIYTLMRTVKATSKTTVEEGDRLELQVCFFCLFLSVPFIVYSIHHMCSSSTIYSPFLSRV